MPRRRDGVVRVALAAVLAASIAGGATGASRQADTDAAGWQGLLGSRPVPQIGGRWIVLFDAPSVADRVREAGGAAGEEQISRWTRIAERAQRQLLLRLAARGAPINPEHSFVRVVNGVSAPLDPRILRVLQDDRAVAGVYAVRASYPAQLEGGVLPDASGRVTAGARPTEVAIPGFDGSGVEIALLDTGVDLVHPYLRGRLLTGLDIVDPGGDASAQLNPTERSRAERHGTELAGLIAGARGPDGMSGVAPGAYIRPIRVAGWQPDASGGVSVYARSDQVLAGLEAAVDPDGDGDTHDAARIALVGVVEPFAGFEDHPLVRAAAGAFALDTLVVAPAGNDGPAGPSFGSVGAPGAGASTVAVAAVDSRRASASANVLLRTGLHTILSGRSPLGGAGVPERAVDLRVIAVAAPRAAEVGAVSALERLFDARGYSRVAGKAVLLPAGPPVPEDVLDLARAGAAAVLVDGPVPAGALGIDERRELPVVGLSAEVATEVRATIKRRLPVLFSIGAAARRGNPARARGVAPFSAGGLAYDGTRKPDLAAPGVGLLTSAPGRSDGGAARYATVSGTSAAAAVAAGAFALLAQARPDLDAAGLKSAAVTTGSALRRGAGLAVPLLDVDRAATVELVVAPAEVGFGALTHSTVVGRAVTIRNVSRRRLVASVTPERTPRGVRAAVFPRRVVIRPGAAVQLGIALTLPRAPRSPSALSGVIRVQVERGATVRFGWTAAVPVKGAAVVSDAKIDPPAFPVSDANPAVLTLTAGRVDGTAQRPQLLPLSSLEIELVRLGKVVGPLAQLRNVLPGRYAFALTGRGTRGGKLTPGRWAIRVTGTPVHGGESTSLVVPFRITPAPSRR